MSEPITITYHTIKDGVPREEAATYIQHNKGTVSGLLLNDKHSTNAFNDDDTYWQKAMVTHNIDLLSYVVGTTVGTIGLPDGSSEPVEYPVLNTDDEDFISFNVPKIKLVEGASVISYQEYQETLNALQAQALQDMESAESLAKRHEDLSWLADVKVALALDVLSEDELNSRFGSDYKARMKRIEG